MSEPRGTSTSDLVGGALVILLGATWIWGAADLGLIGEGGRVEAGTLPALAGGILVLCGAGIAVAGVLGRRRNLPSARASLGSGATGSRRRIAVPKAVTVFGALLVGLLSASVLGFAIAFAAFVFAVIRFVERRSLVVSVGAALAIWALAFVGFEMLLGVPLPDPQLPG